MNIKKLLISTLAVLGLATSFSFADEKKVRFEVTGNDFFQFDKKFLEASVGQEITIVFKNIGKQPKEAVGHNLVVVKPGTVVPQFAMKCASAKGNNYIPTAKADKEPMVASTKILGPGEKDSITFTVEEAGDYPFFCSFPGHFGVMNGTLTVK